MQLILVIFNEANDNNIFELWKQQKVNISKERKIYKTKINDFQK